MSYSLSIGLNDKTTRKQEIETNKAIEVVINLVGDCQIFTGIGVYTHDDGKRVVETTLKVNVFGSDFEQGENHAKKLCEVLNQAEIVVSEIPETKTEFVSA